MNKGKCLPIPEDLTETLSLIHHCGSLQLHLCGSTLNTEPQGTNPTCLKQPHLTHLHLKSRYSYVIAKQFSFVDGLPRWSSRNYILFSLSDNLVIKPDPASSINSTVCRHTLTPKTLDKYSKSGKI